MANYLQAEADRIEHNLREYNEEYEQRHKSVQLSGRKKARGGRRKARPSFWYWVKKAFRFFLIHAGLISGVIIYSVMGAFLFILMESDQESRDCYEGRGEERWLVLNLASQLINYVQNNVTTDTNSTSLDNTNTAYSKIDHWLSSLSSDIMSLRSDYRYIGQDCATGGQWNVANSILFAVQVITTIGYGNITPVTTEGQIVCICYATIGIPLFLMCLANISGDLGSAFRFLYSRIFCLDFWTKLGASNRQKENENKANDCETSVNGSNKPKRSDSQKTQRPKKIFVPISVTLVLITIYIVAGAALFNYFENWEPVTAAYFCFITLATIGFGDVVPGQKPGDPDKIIKLISGSVYIFFGMAVLAMSFDLIQEDMKAKFRWLGTNMRIIDNPEEDTNHVEDTSVNVVKKIEVKPVKTVKTEPEKLETSIKEPVITTSSRKHNFL